MNSVERVKKICKERNIPISKLEKDLGYSNGYIGQLRKGVFPSDRLADIAEYLNLSVSYLMKGEEKDDSPIYYTNKETAAVAQKLFEDDKVLFDVYRSSDKDRLIEYAKKLKALRDMEEGNV